MSVNQVFFLHMCPVLRVAMTSGTEPVIVVPARPKVRHVASCCAEGGGAMSGTVNAP